MDDTQRHADDLVKKASLLVIFISLAILTGLSVGVLDASDANPPQRAEERPLRRW